VFIAGATGAVGCRLVPLALRAGHQVTGTTRSEDKAEALRAAGAAAVVTDALDRAAVLAAVATAALEVVVHQLTALSSFNDLRRFDQEFEATNLLRTQGTTNLLAAAHAAGVRRFVAQSFTGWPYAGTGGLVKTEEDELDPDPRQGSERRSRPFAISSTQRSQPRELTASCCATAGFTDRGPRSARAANTSRRYAAGGSRSSATAPACGPLSTSTT